jgi:CheY-like chemotaxis protein
MTGKRILCIDPDDAFAQQLGTVARRGGFAWTSTGDPAEGLELARSERPDLIVVSVELFPTNGWSICTKLKKDEALRTIPVVLTSAKSTPDTFEKHSRLKTRADEYLLKPFAADELLRAARGLLRLSDIPGREGAARPDQAFVLEDEPLAADEELIELVEEEPPPYDDGVPVDGNLAGATFSDENFADEFLDGTSPAYDALAAGPLLGDRLPHDPLADDLLGLDPLSDSAFTAGSAVEGSLGTDALGTGSFADDFADAELGLGDEPFSDESLVADPLGGELVLEELGLDPAPPDDAAAHDEPASSDDFAAGGWRTAADAEVAGEFRWDRAGESASAGMAYPSGDLSDGAAPAMEAFATAGAPGDMERLFGLEPRIAELEAELEATRHSEAGRGAELERLRGEVGRRDKELREVRDLLRQRDAELDERRETESALSLELGQLRDERARREAAEKALRARAEQLLLSGRKLERELAAAREEARLVAPLRARLAELEREVAQGREAGLEQDVLREQLASAHGDLATAQAAVTVAESELASVRAALETSRREREDLRTAAEAHQEARSAAEAEAEQARAEGDALREDLEEARRTAEKALANALMLQEKLADAEERTRSAVERAVQLEQAADSARGSLRRALEALGPA